MKAIFSLTLFVLISIGAQGNIEPTKGHSQCVKALNNLRVIDVSMKENYRGEAFVRVTLSNGNNGWFQYDFSREHLQMGLALIPMIEKRAGNYQNKINISCERVGGNSNVSLNIYKN
jgi:hypothetical protein